MVFLVGCQTSEQVQQRLVLAFDDATFHVAPDRQGESTIQHNEKLSRWEQDIFYEVKVASQIKDIDQSFVHEAMAKFDELIPINIKHMATPSSKVNFIIRIENKEQFLVNGNQIGGCYAHLDDDGDGQMTEAIIALPGKKPDKAKSCLDHEIMHAIGFTGHTHRIRATLSYMHGEDYITKWDKYLITTLYERDLSAGMARDDVLPIVREITAAQY